MKLWVLGLDVCVVAKNMPHKVCGMFAILAGIACVHSALASIGDLMVLASSAVSVLLGRWEGNRKSLTTVFYEL